MALHPLPTWPDEKVRHGDRGRKIVRFQKLDLNLLVLFDALLVHQNVSRAAGQLNLSQPTLSNALSRLRLHFNDELFVLVGRKMIPTPLAISLREPVSQFLQVSKLIASTRPSFDPSQSEQTFSVVASDYIGSVLLTALSRRLHRVAPNISLRQVPISERAMDRFARGEIDFLVAPDYIQTGLASRVSLFEDRFVPICAKGNETLGDTLSLDQWRDAKQVFAQFGEMYQPSIVEEYMVARGLIGSCRVYIESFSLLAEFIIDSPYIAIVHERYADEKSKQLAIRILRPLFDLPVIYEHLFWLAHVDADPAARWFRAQLIDVATRLNRDAAKETALS